jgi:hypothetical protein
LEGIRGSVIGGERTAGPPGGEPSRGDASMTHR